MNDSLLLRIEGPLDLLDRHAGEIIDQLAFEKALDCLGLQLHHAAEVRQEVA